MWTFVTENSEFAPWQAAQLSPNTVVLASACDAVAVASWQPVQAAVMWGIGLTGPFGLAVPGIPSGIVVSEPFTAVSLSVGLRTPIIHQ